jgi:hypothetical protein
MKMAKASQADIDAAIELYQFLQAIGDGRPAADVVEEFDYKGYGDLLERQAPDVEFLVRAHERGGLFRVVWGLQVLLDPANEVVDPNLPHLEVHPKHTQAAQERDAAREELAAMRADRDAAMLILPACCGSLADAADTLRQQRDTLLKVMAEKDELLDCYRKGMERSATIEPRPWWSVFGLDRILASKMHQQAAKVGPLLTEMALQHLVDEATKRGVHPSEVSCAHREARAELMPDPKPLLARHERERAKASGTDSPHSAASEASKDEKHAEANRVRDREPLSIPPAQDGQPSREAQPGDRALPGVGEDPRLCVSTGARVVDGADQAGRGPDVGEPVSGLRQPNGRLTSPAAPPYEPRPWWEVFGLQRIEASKMHQCTAHYCNLRIHALAERAHQRGANPLEVNRAVLDARQELLPEVKPDGGSA